MLETWMGPLPRPSQKWIGSHFGGGRPGAAVRERRCFPSGVSADPADQGGGCCLPSPSSWPQHNCPMLLEPLRDYCQCPPPGEHLFPRRWPRLCRRPWHPRDQMDRQGDVPFWRVRGRPGARGGHQGAWTPTVKCARPTLHRSVMLARRLSKHWPV